MHPWACLGFSMMERRACEALIQVDFYDGDHFGHKNTGAQKFKYKDIYGINHESFRSYSHK